MEGEFKRAIIREALLSMRESLENKYKDDICRLPRNGKSVSSVSDEANEHIFLERIQAIDELLEEFVGGRKNIGAISGLQSQPATGLLDDREPYMNPFTGAWVFPEHPDQSGPSGSYSRSNDTGTLAPAGDHHHAGDTRPSSIGNIGIPVRTSPPSPGPMEQGNPGGITSRRPSDFNLESLWDTFHGETLAIETETPSDSAMYAGKRFSVRTSSRLWNLPTQAERNPWQLTDERPEFDPPLQQFTDFFEAQNSKITEDGQAAPSVKHDLGSSFDDAGLVPQDLGALRSLQAEQESVWLAISLDQSNREWQSLFDLNRSKAIELAKDTPQNHPELVQAEALFHEKQRQELHAIQDRIHRQDRAEIEATLAQMRRLQEEWNSENDVLQQEQILAQQVAEQEKLKETAATLKEMRRLQDQIQAEDNRAMAEDQTLAREIAEREHSGHSPQAWQDWQSPNGHGPWIELPPYSEYEEIPGGWVDESQTLIVSPPPPEPPTSGDTPTNPSSNPVTSSERAATATKRAPRTLKKTFPRASSGIPLLSTSDKDAIAESLGAGVERRAQWQAEIQKNEAAVQAARKEINRLEEEARREAERERQRQRQKEERRRQEEERVRQQQERQRLEEEQRRQEEERVRLARMIVCNVCTESGDRDIMCSLSCGHSYCQDCIRQSIQNSLKDKKAFQCCKQRPKPSAISTFIPAPINQAYTALLEELDTPQPTYCSNKKCSAFIRPAYYRGESATCPRCSTETCRLCKNRGHQGVCNADKAGQALLNLGNKEKWMLCPHCGAMVERTEGCLHMRCRCGREFCYNCGRPSKVCNGATCTRK